MKSNAGRVDFQWGVFLRICVGSVLCVVAISPCTAQSLKRGLGANDTSLINSVNATWGYNWSASKPSGNLNGDFMPMFWSGGNWTSKFNTVDSYSNIDYILGFNEPERSDQANMTVANAISQWRTVSDQYGGTSIKLVGPAVSDNAAGRAWLDDFMTQVDSDPNLIVDEVAFHWYGSVSGNATAAANSFLNKVDQYHSNYGRNVWVTEFAGIDFAGNFTSDEMQQWNATFLETALPGLESRDYVTRYAWWNHNNDSRLATKDTYNLWRPTRVGDPYVETLTTGETRDMNGSGLGLQMQYLRGGKLLNGGSDLGNAVGRIYVMSNHDGSLATSQFGGDGDFRLQSWGSIRIEENAKLQKVGANTVTLRNVDIYNDGELQLLGNAGTVEITGPGTNAQGGGKIRCTCLPSEKLVLVNLA
ncbi:glycosyl hydrolase [Neorhodopirellula lusitana]|uniref:glycosyl hydrolase n=1 Tax=Neorhodopirellula lusitana TaxID=445327 RepID=UPI00384A713A